MVIPCITRWVWCIRPRSRSWARRAQPAGRRVSRRAVVKRPAPDFSARRQLYWWRLIAHFGTRLAYCATSSRPAVRQVLNHVCSGRSSQQPGSGVGRPPWTKATVQAHGTVKTARQVGNCELLVRFPLCEASDACMLRRALWLTPITAQLIEVLSASVSLAERPLQRSGRCSGSPTITPATCRLCSACSRTTRRPSSASGRTAASW
jgi:hypothetical protein